jgi:hypothetical protein
MNILFRELIFRLRGIRQYFQPLRYKEFYIQRELKDHADSTYLEIGVSRGDCYNKIRAGRKIGVDPKRFSSVNDKTEGAMFFESEAPGLFADNHVNVCLVDGLHTFKQSLADVLNCARWMAPNGVMFIHDCYPTSQTRAAKTGSGHAWNGEVWKTMALIKQSQPEWNACTINTDEGLGIVSGFATKPQPIVSSEYEKADNFTYEHLVENTELISLIDAGKFAAQGFSH